MTPRDFVHRARLKTLAATLPTLLRPRQREDMERLGDGLCGWWVPASLLGPDSVCYLAGAGEDITFDIALMRRFGCEVVSLDPTPRAIEHVRKHAPAQGYHFRPVGLGGKDRVERFYAPANPDHVSHSIANLQDTPDYFEGQLRTPQSVMSQMGHNRIDLLKMDIEGAEYEVFDFLLESALRPTVICVEFDQPAPVRRTLEYVSRLRRAGYEPVKVEVFNVTFVRN